MRQLINTMIVAALAILGCASAGHAWEVEYAATSGLLPTASSPAWGTDTSGTVVTTLDGVLHINCIAGGAGYRREVSAISAGVPVTLETRMSVSASTSGAASLTIGTYSGFVDIAIFPDRLVTSDLNYQPHTFWQDFSALHTIRLAYDGIGGAYAWVDGDLALSWAAPPWSWTTGDPGGVSFGSYLSISDWQYVGYSKEFIPIPEPGSLAALGAGLAGVGMGFARRRRR